MKAQEPGKFAGGSYSQFSSRDTGMPMKNEKYFFKNFWTLLCFYSFDIRNYNFIKSFLCN